MRSVLRRTIALIAAYALALQAIFALSVAASFAASDGITICRNDGTAPGTPPHRACEACLAGHCAGVAGKSQAATFAAPRLASAGPVQAPRFVPLAAPPRRIAAHAPRAPPRA
jgi:hypothetical protein